MSLIIKCTIEIEEQKYETGSVDMDILSESGRSAGTGTFKSAPRELIESLVDAVVEQAKEKTSKKLKVLK